MRTIVRSAIISDSVLLSYGVTPEATLAGNVDTPGGRPFLNLKWGEVLPSVVRAAPVVVTLAIWVHHRPWDYEPIDRILVRLRNLLPTLEGATDAPGNRIQCIDWTSDSGDLQDDFHRTVVKVANFRVVGTRA